MSKSQFHKSRTSRGRSPPAAREKLKAPAASPLQALILAMFRASGQSDRVSVADMRKFRKLAAKPPPLYPDFSWVRQTRGEPER